MTYFSNTNNQPNIEFIPIWTNLVTKKLDNNLESKIQFQRIKNYNSANKPLAK